MLIATNVLLQKLLQDAIDHALAGPYSGGLDGVFVGLSIAPTTGQSPDSTMADITEANYDGYARQAVVWHPPYVEQGGANAVQSASLYWTPTDSTKPNTIVGMFLADANVAGNLLASEFFTAPQALAGPQSAFSLSLIFALAANTGFGGSTIIN